VALDADLHGARAGEELRVGIDERGVFRTDVAAVEVEIDDVQTIDLFSFLSLSTRFEPAPQLEKKVVFIYDETPFETKGCFIKLDEQGHKYITPIKDLCEHLDMLWTGSTIYYFFDYAEFQIMMVEIECPNLIIIKGEIKGQLLESRQPIFQEDSTYLPVPEDVAPYITPAEGKPSVTLIFRSRIFVTSTN
jgi:hypothetical protein